LRKSTTVYVQVLLEWTKFFKYSLLKITFLKNVSGFIAENTLLNLADSDASLGYLRALSSDYVALDQWKSFINTFSQSILDILRVFSIDSIHGLLHNVPNDVDSMAIKLLSDIFRHSVDALNLPMEVLESMRVILRKLEDCMKIKITPKVSRSNRHIIN